MKRIGGLWPQITAFENLLLAWRKARRGKRSRPEVAAFGLNLERELLQLQRELLDGSYAPGPYRQFTIYERKPRVISAAPFRDRVVHHALMNLIEPALDPSFIDDCYACRVGKGVHKAVDRYQQWARRYAYVLKVDVKRYFPSIDHLILKALLRRRLKDPPVLRVLEQIIDGGARPAMEYVAPFPGDDLLTPLERPRGIPIGNLTSQFFANLYLTEIDHRIKENWGAPAYLRYVDDLYFLADCKAQLWRLCAKLQDALAAVRLSLHPNKIQLQRSSERVDVFGYLVSRQRRWLRNDNGFRFARRLRGMARAYAAGRVDLADIDPRIQAWIGHAQHGETAGLRARVFSSVAFARSIAAGAGL